jgi:RNA polymerase sigma-70 factor (ECF subfamily)
MSVGILARQRIAGASPSKSARDVRGAAAGADLEERRRGVPGDRELARRCREGDAAAFEELYRLHASRLYSLLVRMTGSAEEAEDLLQDVFVTAHRKIGGFRGDSALGTWLYRMAVNHCLDFLRGRRAKMAKATSSLDEDDAVEPAAVMPVVPEAVSRIDLERAIARLPDGCRTAFVLHDIEGFEHHEIGQLLGISEGTSKSQVHKARVKLRTMLSGVTVERTASRS